VKSPRSERLEAIRKRLAGRKIVWFGTRGADAQPLLEIPELTDCFSQVAPLGALKLRTELCLEVMRGHRVDLNTYDIDLDSSEEAQQLHRELVRACSSASVLVAYRPARFLTSAYFPRTHFVEYLGMFHESQMAFEHKPWVESMLREEGIRVVPWRYFGKVDLRFLEDAFRSGPLVVRANRSSGGVGLTLVEEPTGLPSRLDVGQDRFVAVAPFLWPNIPLNVSGCVFPGGDVRLYAPSLQLIGTGACTARRFGYCGNDFASIRDIDTKILDQFEQLAMQTGKNLWRHGYLGTFGLDALIYKGQVYVTEVNPRFQGSSALAARLCAGLDLPDLYLDHLAAFLGLDPSPLVPLRTLAWEQQAKAQVIRYNLHGGPVTRKPAAELPRFDGSQESPQLLPEIGVSVAHEAILFRLVVNRRVTEDGYRIDPSAEQTVRSIAQALFEPTARLSSGPLTPAAVDPAECLPS